MGLDNFHKQSRFDCKKHFMLNRLENFISIECNLYFPERANDDAIRSVFKKLTDNKRADLFKKLTTKSRKINH